MPARRNQPLSLIDASEGHAFVSIIANTLDIDQKMVRGFNAGPGPCSCFSRVLRFAFMQRVGRAVNVRLLRDNIPVRV